MKMRRSISAGRPENIRDHIRKERKSIIKRYQSKRTVGHTGIARECFAQRGNRTRSPHFKRELSGGSMSQEYIGECYEIAESSEKIYIGKEFPDEFANAKDARGLKGANAKAKANAAQGN